MAAKEWSRQQRKREEKARKEEKRKIRMRDEKAFTEQLRQEAEEKREREERLEKNAEVIVEGLAAFFRGEARIASSVGFGGKTSYWFDKG